MDTICKFVENSWEVNMKMSGLGSHVDEKYSIWSSQDITRFKKQLKLMAVKIGTEKTVYRGTYNKWASPIIEKNTILDLIKKNPEVSFQFMKIF
jgi:predicted enzyme involved in methoxymalonyl-ACP biosynthesis